MVLPTLGLLQIYSFTLSCFTSSLLLTLQSATLSFELLATLWLFDMAACHLCNNCWQLSWLELDVTESSTLDTTEKQYAFLSFFFSYLNGGGGGGSMKSCLMGINNSGNKCLISIPPCFNSAESSFHHLQISLWPSLPIYNLQHFPYHRKPRTVGRESSCGLTPHTSPSLAHQPL